MMLLFLQFGLGNNLRHIFPENTGDKKILRIILIFHLCPGNTLKLSVVGFISHNIYNIYSYHCNSKKEMDIQLRRCLIYAIIYVVLST